MVPVRARLRSARGPLSKALVTDHVLAVCQSYSVATFVLGGGDIGFSADVALGIFGEVCLDLVMVARNRSEDHGEYTLNHGDGCG